MHRWNQRYREGCHGSEDPDPLVVKFASTLEPGRALDVACGLGRHAIWLAEHGWQVTAVDYSDVAIETLRKRSAERGVPMDARLADLERHDFVIEPQSFDLIVVCNYLQRDLFPAIKAGLRADGLIVAAISMLDDAPGLKPMNPAYLLSSGELRSEFKTWEIAWDFEGNPVETRRKRAEIVARRPV